MALAGIAIGTFVAVAGFSDYGPLVGLEMGSTIIGVSLVGGVLLGLLSRDEEPGPLILRAFLASVIAIAMVALTVLAPVLAGVLSSLEDLGSSGTSRLALIFTSLFIVPMVVVGAMIGYALADYFAPARMDGGLEPY